MAQTLERSSGEAHAHGARGFSWMVITIDKSGANTAAIEGLRADSGAEIELRQSKYLNNIVEQDHRAITRVVRPTLGFKSSEIRVSAKNLTPLLRQNPQSQHNPPG